jgi:hypothetical protein
MQDPCPRLRNGSFRRQEAFRRLRSVGFPGQEPFRRLRRVGLPGQEAIRRLRRVGLPGREAFRRLRDGGTLRLRLDRRRSVTRTAPLGDADSLERRRSLARSLLSPAAEV